MKIHKHEISVWVDENLEDQIREGSPKGKTKNNGYGYGWGWIWCLIGAVVLFALLGR